LRQFLLVKLEPAVLRNMLDAATVQRKPVNYDLSITAYPRKAHGLARVVGELKTPPDEPQADEPKVIRTIQNMARGSRASSEEESSFARADPNVAGEARAARADIL
jgi:hypothetical protein